MFISTFITSVAITCADDDMLIYANAIGVDFCPVQRSRLHHFLVPLEDPSTFFCLGEMLVMQIISNIFFIRQHSSGGSKIFRGGDFGNSTRTKGVWAYGRILYICESGRWHN